MSVWQGSIPQGHQQRSSCPSCPLTLLYIQISNANLLTTPTLSRLQLVWLCRPLVLVYNWCLSYSWNLPPLFFLYLFVPTPVMWGCKFLLLLSFCDCNIFLSVAFVLHHLFLSASTILTHRALITHKNGCWKWWLFKSKVNNCGLWHGILTFLGWLVSTVLIGTRPPGAPARHLTLDGTANVAKLSGVGRQIQTKFTVHWSQGCRNT